MMQEVTLMVSVEGVCRMRRTSETAYRIRISFGGFRVVFLISRLDVRNVSDAQTQRPSPKEGCTNVATTCINS